MAHFISQTVEGEGETLPHGLLLFAAVVVVVVVAATEPALCIVAISAAGAFFYVITNGRHCWGRRRGRRRGLNCTLLHATVECATIKAKTVGESFADNAATS